jgi:RecJ-like exonuclease
MPPINDRPPRQLHPKTVALLARLKAQKKANCCKACEGKGTASNGTQCYPCQGKGVQQ